MLTAVVPSSRRTISSRCPGRAFSSTRGRRARRRPARRRPRRRRRRSAAGAAGRRRRPRRRGDQARLPEEERAHRLAQHAPRDQRRALATPRRYVSLARDEAAARPGRAGCSSYGRRRALCAFRHNVWRVLPTDRRPCSLRARERRQQERRQQDAHDLPAGHRNRPRRIIHTSLFTPRARAPRTGALKTRRIYATFDALYRRLLTAHAAANFFIARRRRGPSTPTR